MEEHNECTIAHLSMIQGVITRLETNSFTLKALAMTLAAAVLAFMGSLKNPNWIYPLAGCLPVIVFWFMDAKYLRLGRLFRKLFDAVRNHEVKEPFTMNYSLFEKDVQHTLRIAFSWSILWFYLSIFIILLLVSFFLLK